MKPYLTIITVTFVTSLVKCGQLLDNYNNLIPSPFIVPQTFHSLQIPQTRVVPGILSAPQQQNDISHPAVVENAIAESQLPSELLNPFYKNPGIASALAKESWFTNKEFLVRHREAEKIPRQEIYKIVSRLQRRKR